MEIHMLFPDPRKHFPVRRRFFHFQEGGDVHRLKLKVVVGHGLLWHRIVKGEMVDLRKSLIGTAQSPADILSVPAGHQFLLIEFFVHRLHNLQI